MDIELEVIENNVNIEVNGSSDNNITSVFNEDCELSASLQDDNSLVSSMNDTNQEVDARVQDLVVINEATNDYTELINKPQINSVTLIGNKSFSDLGIIPITNAEIDVIAV